MPAVPIPKHPGASWDLPDRYKVTELIGSGSYGSVCQAEDSQTNQTVAIKRCKHVFEDLVDCKRILREIAILAKLNHANVVRISDIVAPKNVHTWTELYMVMELCDSDLKKLCKQDVSLSHLHISTLLYNMLCGLKHIHSAGVYHRDMKPANCFVNQDCTVKIGDFGLARALEGEEFPQSPRDGEEEEDAPVPKGTTVPHTQRLKKHMTGHVVTRWYRAPELILLQEDYTSAIDVWSAGCIYAELLGMVEGKSMLDRGPLFPGGSCFPLSPDHKHKTDYKYHTQGKQDMLNKIFNVIGTPSDEDKDALTRADAKKYLNCFSARPGDGLKSILENVPEDSLDILGKMLKFNHKKRTTVEAALNHEIFTKVRDPAGETNAPGKISLEFEKEPDLNEKLLRKYFCQEMRKYHPEVEQIVV